MSCFFSGTDLSTLHSEGNDQNCFVSLIVNNAGKYCAAVTRKVRERKEITTTDLGSSYEFFGDGSISLAYTQSMPFVTTIDSEVIEYFMLDVEVEQVDNPLAYLDTRFDEIEARKKASKAIPVRRPLDSGFDEDYSFRDYLNARKEEEEPTLWTKEEMEATEVKPDAEKWELDPTVIHHLVCQMVTCSLIIDTTKLDLKQWITRHMVKKYEEIFETEGDSGAFEEWKEFIVEFMINRLVDATIPVNSHDDWELLQKKIASAMYDELCQYPTNEYIEEYKGILTRYMYE